MNIAFLLLAHSNQDRVLALIEQLTSEGDYVVLHWDAKTPFDFREYAEGLLPQKVLERVRFAARAEVRWGEWGMVEATLRALECLTDMPQVEYVYLLSSSDVLIKPLKELKKHLAAHKGRSFIECVNPMKNKWVIRGLVHERYQHFSFFNWQERPKLFSLIHTIQKKLRFKRRVPENLTMYFGSQWWCLTYSLAMNILRKARTKKIERFFKRTSVPDELFFQTLAASFENPETFLPQLTYYTFDSTGKPQVFYDDHISFIQKLPHFFIRKVSDQAHHIRKLPEGRALPEYDSHKYKNTNAFYIPQVSADTLTFYGALLQNTKRYYCLYAFNMPLLRHLYKTHSENKKFTIIFNPFHEKMIAYGKNTRAHPFYEREMVLRRNHDPMTFLHCLLQYYEEPSIVCFLPAQNEIFYRAFWDKNSTPIFLLPSYIADNVQLRLGAQGVGLELRPGDYSLLSLPTSPGDILFPTGVEHWPSFAYYILECYKANKKFLLMNEKHDLASLCQRPQNTSGGLPERHHGASL